LGGLPKKAQQLEILREKETAVVALDSGALLFKEEKIPLEQVPQLSATAHGIVSAYNHMSFAAVGVARQDLAAGLAFLLALQKKSDFPWLSANLVSRTQGKPYFKPHTLLRAGGMNIGVIGLTGQGPDTIFTEKDNAVILPWEEALPRELSRLKGRADMVILLSNLSAPLNKKIAEKHPEIHLILQSGSASVNLLPERSNNTLITQVEQQGKSVGILKVHWNARTKRWEDRSAENLLLEKKNELDRLGWRIGRARRQGDPKVVFKDQPEVLAAYDAMLAQRAKLEQEIAGLMATHNARDAGRAGFSSFSHRFEAMHKELPDNPAVLAIVEATTTEVNRLGKLAAKARVAAPLARKKGVFPKNYAGSIACRSCHEAQFQKWRSTKHASAYTTLENKRQQFNLQCLPCHVTGAFDQPGEKVLNLAHDLRHVGCETCHGPAKEHAARPQTARAGQPTEETCLRCHTEEHDDNFILSEALGRLRCGS
jgi:2',3'-cyclic-nucleotide 2'-phosphodiesterase (5'-nucleotidase family)